MVCQATSVTSPEPGTHQVNRAVVRHELTKLESVGYRLTPNDLYYPDDIQAAERAVSHTLSDVLRVRRRSNQLRHWPATKAPMISDR
jgi:hypothetical protein